METDYKISRMIINITCTKTVPYIKLLPVNISSITVPYHM